MHVQRVYNEDEKKSKSKRITKKQCAFNKAKIYAMQKERARKDFLSKETENFQYDLESELDYDFIAYNSPEPHAKYHYRVDLTLPDLTTELVRMGVITAVKSDASSSCPAPVAGVVGSDTPAAFHRGVDAPIDSAAVAYD